MNQNLAIPNPKSPVPNGKTEGRNPQSALPLWQQLSGLTKDAEPQMTDEQRDEAIRALLKKADELAAAEFARVAPEGERTFIWNPIERICYKLGIARSKLSQFCRELTGLSAYEFADRHPARALKERVGEWVGGLLKNFRQILENNIGISRTLKENFKVTWREWALRKIREARKGSAALRWAAELKFANTARMRRACLAVHGATIEELEERTVLQLVQKIFDEFAAHLKTLPDPLERERHLFGTHIRVREFTDKFGYMPKTKKEMYEAYGWQWSDEKEKKEAERLQREEKHPYPNVW
ncbi:MAG TPA: hypothetical protein VEJ63_12690 [Planctomycetota bacterium]|nr:hypothetical protein [Planctomycetota bacterium]